MMKTHHVALALVSVVLSGCAIEPAPTRSAATDLTRERVHTQEELKKTGEPEIGPALEKVDPAVQVSGPH